MYAYSVWQSAYDDVENVEFVKGLPSLSQIREDTLLILDDVMMEASSNPEILHLFTVLVHHLSITVVILLQNLYFSSKFLRTLSLNTQYIVLFDNARDRNQITVLARQAYPRKTSYFLSSFADATSQKHGYLVCNFHPQSSRRFPLLTNIVPSDCPIVYVEPENKTL